MEQVAQAAHSPGNRLVTRNATDVRGARFELAVPAGTLAAQLSDAALGLELRQAQFGVPEGVVRRLLQPTPAT